MPGRIIGDGTRMPVRPFSDYKNRVFCMKDNCNALFFTVDLLAIHKRFCHSEHPLGGGSSETEERRTRRIRGEVEDMVVNAEIIEKQSEEDIVYQMMKKMSSQFFDEFLGKGRKGNIPAEGGEGKSLE